MNKINGHRFLREVMTYKSMPVKSAISQGFLCRKAQASAEQYANWHYKSVENPWTKTHFVLFGKLDEISND